MATYPGTRASDPDRDRTAAALREHHVAGRPAATWRGPVRSWLTITVLLLVIWLISGANGSLWFLWVAVPLGVLMVGRRLTIAPRRSEGGSVRGRREHRHQDRPARRQ
jgi:fatty acid desaturase